MTDDNATHEQQEQAEAHAPYIKVWLALLVLTVLEYFYAKFLAGNMFWLVIGLMALASVKAGLVGWYFMHVKFEGKWVFAVIIPAAILAAIVIFGLMPDIASPQIDPAEEDELAWVAPAEPMPSGTAPALRV